MAARGAITQCTPVDAVGRCSGRMSLGRPSTLLNPSEPLLQPSNDCGRNKNSMDRTVERVGGVEEHTSKVVAVLRFKSRNATGVVAVLRFMRRDATGEIRERCLPICAYVYVCVCTQVVYTAQAQSSSDHLLPCFLRLIKVGNTYS